MLLQLNKIDTLTTKAVTITGSKSETNRLLMLQALFQGFEIHNPSNSDDGDVMRVALQSDSTIIDINHAGTAMRFLTAYFAVQEGREILLTGSERMQERPMKILVEALQSLGAEISYQKNEGYPPLIIKGTRLIKNNVTLKANVSSQYISALMLIGASLENGLKIHLDGKITSVPYINMTLQLLQQLGIEAQFKGQEIVIKPFIETPKIKELTVESDWSSVSYFYSIVMLSRKLSIPVEKTHQDIQIRVSSYKKDSLQGDAVLQELYSKLGVVSRFEGNVLILSLLENFEIPHAITFDLANAPDIAQTIAVSCLGLGIGCTLTGLHTLKIKETDRLEALKTEITKLGGAITVTNDTLILEPQKTPLREDVAIATYHDHRMAMAFAPLALCTTLKIEDAGVVSKSYPDFWADLEALGFSSNIIE